MDTINLVYKKVHVLVVAQLGKLIKIMNMVY